MAHNAKLLVTLFSLIIIVFLGLVLLFSLTMGDIMTGISEAILVMAFLGFIIFILLNRKLIEAEKRGNWDERLVRFLRESESPVWPILLFAILVYFIFSAYRRADTLAYLGLGLVTILVLITIVRYLIRKRRPSKNTSD